MYYGPVTSLKNKATLFTNIVYQDNMSALSLAKNGYASRSKCTKHVNAKYLYVRHYHKSGELALKYCPTDEMWADVLNKRLQGSKFSKMRAFLMNCATDYTLKSLVLLLAQFYNLYITFR